MNEPLSFATEEEAEDAFMLHERFAFALRAYGITDGALLDHATLEATRAVWPMLKRDEEVREAARVNIRVVE